TGLDDRLAGLLREAPELELRTQPADLYVISENEGFAAALPKAAASKLRSAGLETLATADALRERLAAQCRWLDAVLNHLQQLVAERAEDGGDLLERWADPNWSV